MVRIWGRDVVGLCLLVFVGATVRAGGVEGAAESARHRGVCFVAGRYRPSEEAFDRLAGLNVNWISQTPFGWQRRHDDPEVIVKTSGRVWWGESDSGLVETARRAKQRGIRTILKPHIWIRDRSNGKWRGEIDFSEAAWKTWWTGYRRMILHYAELAEAHGMEALCIGTELRSTVVKHPEEWRRLIADVRKVYRGALTYSANWYREFEEVPFWDALDFIGIQAYFPLAHSQGERPNVEALKAAWKPYLEQVEALQKRVGKLVIFTEVGYRSAADAAVEPWTWRSDAPVDTGLQAACYEAMFQTFWEQPWLAGVYIWKWFPGQGRPVEGRRARRRVRGFTPQGKPAEGVLARWYTGEIEAVE